MKQADQGSNDSAANPAAMPDPGKKGYGSGGCGSEGYSGRADVFVSAFLLFTSEATGNSIAAQPEALTPHAAEWRESDGAVRIR